MAAENIIFEETASTIKKLTAEEKIQLQCEARQRYEWDRISAIDYGKRRGLEEGIQIGAQKKLISLVCKKLSKGMSPTDIADALALTYIQDIIPIGLIEADREIQNRYML